MKKNWKKVLFFVCLLGVMPVFAGCGKESSQMPFTYRAHSEPKEDQQETESQETKEYIIEQLDMVEETITLYSPDSGRQLRYGYTLSTRFKDKYGDSCSVLHFTPGQVVKIGEVTEQSVLRSVQMSDQVWNQTDIENFNVDVQKRIFTIGRTDYRITDRTKVYSGDALVALETIGENDVLQVIGRDKEIWSVVVTTGHGYVQLQNSETFVGSLICIGNRIIANVTGDMLIEVPEGSYDITVANNGYGGTGSYTVMRGQTTTVDLDQLKGSGPKVCQLTFESQVAGVEVYVDGKAITVGQATGVAYGTHTLKVVAPGYDTWQKTLVVNSPSATIALDLAETETDTGTSESGTADMGSASTESGSSATDQNKTETSGKDKDEETSDKLSDTEADYLTTISQMISTLLGD